MYGLTIALKKLRRWYHLVDGSLWFFGTRPMSLEKIDLDFWLKSPQFLLGDSKDWTSETFLLSEKEIKLEERVVKISIFSVVVESKCIGEA